MATFIVTWNPDKWHLDDQAYAAWVEDTANGETLDEPWSTGVRTSGIEPWDRAFLLRQHRDRGIVASGYFTSEVFQDEHWDPDRAGEVANYAQIEWDIWLLPEDRLPTETLQTEIPTVAWRNMQSSGVEVPSGSCRDLDQLWEDHLESLGWEQTWLPEEIRPSETFAEGSATTTTVNSYERDPRARTACIDHYGTDCAVCGFDFAARYGEDLGGGFIHVHHILDLSLLGTDYEVDPVKDLRPVCPNCHAMLHRVRPALPINDLKGHLRPQ